MRAKDVGESKCYTVMAQIEVNISFRKEADFQQVLYYNKAFKLEKQMNQG